MLREQKTAKVPAAIVRVWWKQRVTMERGVLCHLNPQRKTVHIAALKLLNRRIPNGTYGGVRGRLLN